MSYISEGGGGGASSATSISQFNPHADGVTDDSAAFTAACAAASEVWLDAGKSYFIGTNLTLACNLRFLGGAKMIVGGGFTLTLNGAVFAAPNQQIFQATGTSALYVTDTLQRADENPLSNGGKWVARASGVTNAGALVGHNYQMTGTGVAGGVVWNPATNAFPNDQFAEVTIGAAPDNNGGVYLFCRAANVASDSNYYASANNLGSAPQVLLHKTVAGADTPLGTVATPIVVGSKLRLTCIGTKIVASIDGKPIISVTDAAVTAGQPGMEVFDSGGVANARITNFVAGSAQGSVVFGGNQAEVFPEWFGAVGDGATDDTIPLQQAINSLSTLGLGGTTPPASSGGGTVVLQAKRYALTYPLKIASSWVGIRGQGQRNSALYFTGATTLDVLQLIGFSQVYATGYAAFNRFSDFTILRNAAGTSVAAGIRLNYTIVANFTRVDSFDSVYCYYQQSCANSFYKESYVGNQNFTPTTSYGMYFVSDAGNGSFESTSVIDCAANSATTYGMYLTGVGVRDFYARGFECAGGSYGIYIASTDHSTTSFNNGNLHFQQCILDLMTVSAVYITGVYQAAASIDFDSCYFFGTSAATGPLFDIENSSGVNIRGCLFEVGRALAAVRGVLINAANSYGNSVVGNQFIAQANGVTAAIEINASNNNIVMGNVIVGPDSTHKWALGVSLITALRNIIVGNHVQGFGTLGFSYPSGSNNNVSTGNTTDPTNVTTAKTDGGTGNGAGV